MSRPAHIRWLVVAIALASACAKDKSTALDVKLTVTGDLDQLSIDAIQVGTKTLDLTGEQTKFSAAGRMLRTGDVVTIWFADSADMQSVVVTATGLLCGRSATTQAMTPTKMLAKGQTVQTTLTLVNNGTVCDNDGGSGGAGGTTGAGGTGGAAGSGGTTGTAGTGGAGGTAGASGTGGTAGTAGTGGPAGRGGTTGTAGTGGAAGRGGTTGTAGTGGAAGRGGTTGTAGTGGAAGRGGTTGTAGTGGAAGRGGTTGTAGTGGAAGRGGTTGTGGAAAVCGTTPQPAKAQPSTTPAPTGMAVTSCGYPLTGTVVQYILPQGSDAWAVANAAALTAGGVGNANCGRCVQIVRSMSGAPPRPAVVTLVGACPDPACQADPTPRFEIGSSTYTTMLATANEPSLPANASETLTYSFVPCPLAANQTILANFKNSGGAVASVLFLQHRYGIASATVEDPSVGQQMPMSRGNDGYWFRNDGNPLPAGTIVPIFRLTDVNSSLVTLNNLPPTNTPMFASTGQQFPQLCTP